MPNAWIGSDAKSIIDDIRDEWGFKKNTIDKAIDEQKDTSSLTEFADTLQTWLIPYVDRVVVLSLIVAVILIIINGFLMVTQSDNDSVRSNTRKRLLHLLLGVFVIFGFSAIIRLTIQLLSIIW